jgi:hypothetical protein
VPSRWFVRSAVSLRNGSNSAVTSAGIDRDGTTGAWLLSADPDACARALHDQLTAATRLWRAADYTSWSPAGSCSEISPWKGLSAS